MIGCLPDGMDDVEAGGSDPAVSHRVPLERSRVIVLPDTSTIVGPVAHSVVGVASILLLDAEGGGIEVTPSFTHTTGLKGGKAVDVEGTTGETVGKTVSVLKYHHLNQRCAGLGG